MLYSCNPTKHVQPGEIFLQKVSIKKHNRKIPKDDLVKIIKQKPNKKILNLFRFHLGIYNISNKKNATSFKDFGEPPVIYDSLLTSKTVSQLGIYLKNHGYFNNEVSYTSKPNKNKIKVNYILKPGKPHTFNEVNYEIEDLKIKTIVLLHHFKSQIRPGNNFNIDVLDDERKRIVKTVKNYGYYYFTKDYIKFKVDSTIGNNQVNVTVKIPNNDNKSYAVDFNTYNIGDINVFISKNLRDSLPNDTITYKGVNILYNNQLKITPKTLTHSIGLKKGSIYQLENHQSTYKHLTELRLFRSVNIGFEKGDSNELNTFIYLNPSSSKSFAIEPTITHSGGNLGLKGSVVYQNKNTFRGGENLTLKINGGVEAQQLINSNETETNNNIAGLFNTIEFGPELNLEIPRFLIPFLKMEQFSRRMNPKTSINSLLNHQNRPEYRRNLFQTNFGYFWRSHKYLRHFVNPIEVSLIKLNSTPEFQKVIDEEDNPFIKNSYSDHFINGSSYLLIYNNQKFNKRTDFTYFKFKVEFAGNLPTLYNNIFDKPYDNPDTKSYNIFGIRYSQYIKADVDLRFYKQNKPTTFVQRINIGIGKPYGNLNVLPFEKTYFGGGANGIRAWQARSLGPGSLPDSLGNGSVNQIGELKIEGNLEYRFDIYSFFKGAAFVDAGNIWILSPDENRPNAEINFDRFWDDVAIGVGLGLRLDFNFFLIRFDLAAKLKDPALANPRKFDLQWKSPTLNLGIGYPF